MLISFNDKEVELKFNQMINDFSDFSEPFENTGRDLLGFFGKEVFETQGKANGEKWKALALSTLTARRKRRGHYALRPIATDKILIWTGRLKSGFRKEVRPRRLRIYNKVSYFKHLQPKRHMLDINQKVIHKVKTNFYKFLIKSINK